MLNGVWGSASGSIIEAGMMVALAHAGNYIVGAYEGDELVGACVAFFHVPAHRALHSHLAAVIPSRAGRGIGAAMKVHQRDWARTHGADHVTWTFDPLIARNAWFNIARLGVRITEYLPNFYGTLDDALNRGMPTDRLMAVWDVGDSRPKVMIEDEARHAPADVLRCEDDRPVVNEAVLTALTGEESDHVGAELVLQDRLRVAVPPDIESLRATAPDLARQWSDRFREVMTAALARGWRIDGFARDGWYDLRREDS